MNRSTVLFSSGEGAVRHSLRSHPQKACQIAALALCCLMEGGSDGSDY